MPYTVRHVIDTDADTLWRLLFDQNVIRSMLQRAGSHGEICVLEERHEGPLFHRRIVWRSSVELPSLAQKLVGDGSFTEVGCFDRERMHYTAQYIPSFGSDKVRTQFEITVEPANDGIRSTRQITTENTISVFGLGGMIARAIEHGQRASHDHSARFLNAWVREMGLTQAT